jgi:hypothetical protein
MRPHPTPPHTNPYRVTFPLPNTTASLPTPRPYKSLPPHLSSTNHGATSGFGPACLLDDAFMVKSCHPIIFTSAFDYFFIVFFKVPPNSFTIKASSNKQAGPKCTTYYWGAITEI